MREFLQEIRQQSGQVVLFDVVWFSCIQSFIIIIITTCRSSFSRVNPDTIGCVWTGEFDLNTLRVDGKIFESGKKKLRISNIL